MHVRFVEREFPQVLQLRQVFRPSLHVRVVEMELRQVLQLRHVFRPSLHVRCVRCCSFDKSSVFHSTFVL